MSDLDRYKDKGKVLAYRKKYNQDNYRNVLLTFNKEKDKELLEELDNAKSKTELVRKWRNCNKLSK